jgi:hypothetical protein
MQCTCSYSHPWPTPLYNIFPHFLINDTFFEKSYQTQNMCFDFFLQLLSETFRILRRNEQDKIKNVHWSSCKVSFVLVQFERKLNFLDRFSKKFSNIKFHGNLSSGSRVVPCGRTDGQMTKLIVVFRNFANAPKNTAAR